MLTKRRVEKVLDLIKKEYDYIDNRPIYIYIDNHNWCVETEPSYYNLRLSKEFKDYDFTIFFYRYLYKEFNFDLTWVKVDCITVMEALVLLHEIGHIKQSIDINISKRYTEIMDETYQNYREKTSHMSNAERVIAYRKIPYEHLADEFAVNMFNKYAIKILAILKGTTQKKIKSRLAEVKKETI